MPTDLPFVNFLRKSATDGFTLLETMLSLTVLGILLILSVPDFFPMLQSQRF
jgi:prepilin-type N-terminal cleavage/methylation domain